MSRSASSTTQAIGVTVDALAMAGNTMYVWDAGERTLQRYDDITTMSTTTPTPDAEVKIEGADVFKITNVLDITVVGGDVYATTFQKLVFKIAFSSDPLTEVGDLTPNSSDTLTQGITAPDSSTIVHYDPNADTLYSYNLSTGAINTVGNPGRGRWLTHDGTNYICGDGTTIQQAIASNATWTQDHQALGWFDQSSPQQLMLTDPATDHQVERISDPFGTPSTDKTWSLGDEEGTYVTWEERCTDANGDPISLDSVELDQVTDDGGTTTQKTGSDRSPSWLNWHKKFNSGTPSELLVDLLLEQSSLQIGYEYVFELVASDDQALNDLRTVTLTVSEAPLLDGSKMYTLNQDASNIDEYDLSTQWEISSKTHKQAGSVPVSDPEGLFFRPNGERVFFTDDDGSPSVEQMDLSTPWDISTLQNKQSTGFNEDDFINGICLGKDGTVAHVCPGDGWVHRYTLSSAWDITSISLDSNTDISAQTGSPTGIDRLNDGDKYYVCGFNGNIFEYSVGTNFDFGTSTHEHTLSLSNVATPYGIYVRKDGAKIFVVDRDNANVAEYSLSTPGDLSTASFVQTVDISSQVTLPFGLSFGQ